MLDPYVPEELTSYIVEAYVALRTQSGVDAKNGDQVQSGVNSMHASRTGITVDSGYVGGFEFGKQSGVDAKNGEKVQPVAGPRTKSRHTPV